MRPPSPHEGDTPRHTTESPPLQKWLWGPWGCAELRVSHSSANKCLLKVATYAAQLEQYQKAVEIYEQVGAVGLLPCSEELGGEGGVWALCPIAGGLCAPEVVLLGSLEPSAP